MKMYSQWTGSGSGFNVTVTDGTNSYALRIDNDVDVYSKAAPVGKFNVSGLLGQYDKTSPYLDGYQLFPRYESDFDPYNTEGYPYKTIGEVTVVDDSGIALSDGENCEL
ncbi:MAG: hypothetical protein R2771_13945 [Saprospiraceae bacterium]